MDQKQLEQCIKEYGKEIYAFCSQMTCNTQEAEDLYQDTFLKAVEFGNRIDYAQNPKSYLVSIALRIWKNRKRKYAWRNRIVGMVQLSVADIAEVMKLPTATVKNRLHRARKLLKKELEVVLDET